MMIETNQQECPECHIIYWISTAHHNRLVGSKESFYCPNGHSSCYLGKTDLEKLQEKEKELEKAKEYIDEGYKREEKMTKEVSSLKGQVTKLKHAHKKTTIKKK